MIMENSFEIVVRVHEVALKGRNRPVFLQALAKHLKKVTRNLGVSEVVSHHLLIRLKLESDADWGTIKKVISMVPGAVKFSLVRRVPADFNEIASAVNSLVSDSDFATFRISSRRSDKKFEWSSREMNVSLGALVEHSSGAKVDLSNPELDIHVDVLSKDAFVWSSDEEGMGGLPTGTGGKVAVLMSGGIDSPVAAWRMIKRGCEASLIHFHSFPLVEGRSREKAMDLATRLTEFQLNTFLHLVPFAPLQQEIILSVPGPLRVVIYRRFMFRIAELIAKTNGARALVTGESLGQVGSQTLINMATVDEAAAHPILRPLIGMDKSEIIHQAQQIKTYSISILPDEDCCTLFVPKSPSTKVSYKEALSAETNLDIERMVIDAVSKTETYRYKLGESPVLIERT